MEKIIAEVRKYDCLYNIQSPSYKKYQYKENIWKQIGEELQLPVEEVKKKFRNMRDAYKKSKKIADTATDTLFRKPYKYAEQLKFLDDLPTADITSNHISESSLDVTTASCSDSEVPHSMRSKVKIESNDDLLMEPLVTLTTPGGNLPNITTKNKFKRKAKRKKNCTMQLFQCLANKVTDTKLTMEQRNDIESSVCKLVYSKIAQYTINCTSSC